MNVNEAVDIAERLESLVRRSRTYGYDADDLRYEIRKLASEYRNIANELDEAMYEELGYTYEKYDDAMIVAGA
jgi:hypothetical protein